ncbi:MAG: HIT domain-containing protein [Oceanospirillaceae bacterium]|nr:HIT domain-containing protein [Oceanospirillaceae bacterium]
MDELEIEFVLDTQLERDSIFLGELPLCRLLLINDKQFPWFVLVPRRAETYELYHLSLQDRVQMMDESCDLSAALADGFNATKMNVAALGNVVKQLHVHHIVRYDTDVAWPAPVWGKQSLQPYTEGEIESIRVKVNALLEAKLSFTPVV